MQQQLSAALITGLFYIVLAMPVQATLIDRGNGLIYDSDQNITWLQDANFNAGSRFDDGSSNSDGLMTWASAIVWADRLEFGGFSNWRLPMTKQPDPTCSNSILSTGSGCTGSEMGHLFNIDGISSDNPGLFTNFMAQISWSETEVAPSLQAVFLFKFFDGVQTATPNRNIETHVFAVHAGDIGAIPIPATVWLFGTGLIGLLGFSKRKQV